MTGQEALNILCSSATVVGISDSSSADTVWRATVLEYLKLVVKDIQNRQQSFHWRFLEKTSTASTVADQHSYDLPTDIDTNKILAVYERTNDVTYRFIDYNLFVRLVADPSADNSDPGRFYTLFANTLRIWPVPDSVITIYMDFVKLITAPADSTVALDIPSKYDQVIINGALSMIYRFNPDLGDWATQHQLYESGIRLMIQDNMQVIGETMQPLSHRSKRRSPRDIEGASSLFFPLDRTNV